MFSLRNRSFLKEIDFEPRELRHLLQLAEALKIAKYAGTEARRLAGKEIAMPEEPVAEVRSNVMSASGSTQSTA